MGNMLPVVGVGLAVCATKSATSPRKQFSSWTAPPLSRSGGNSARH